MVAASMTTEIVGRKNFDATPADYADELAANPRGWGGRGLLSASRGMGHGGN
ncbi:MAG: hypothetical protein CM15mP46_4090 [Alphaproteobacteria bacterium]|nr:MAG: hypothetical protein CM15mP46_4090 [Alphaproteobacteria bacterium]